jgi:hypothetical protein
MGPPRFSSEEFMSHFTVLVIGDNPEAQLAPYHEFECTGIDDQHVVDVDKTDEAREEYANSKSARYRAPDGSLHNLFTPKGDWDYSFFRDATEEELSRIGTINAFDNRGTLDGRRWTSTPRGGGHVIRIQSLADGWNEVEVPTSEVETFAEWVEGWYGIKVVHFGEQPDATGNRKHESHKYGYALLDIRGDVVKVVKRTNPNKKWDWYQIGGRWTGFFKLKVHAMAGALGIASLLCVMELEYKAPGADRADQCFIGDVDVEGMRSEAGTKAAETYDKFHLIADPHPLIVPWSEIRERHGDDIEAARKEYHAQPGVKALNATKEFSWDCDPSDYAVSREVFIQKARDRAFTTFAVVKDGQWYEKGSMGWWGMVSGEQDQQEWNAHFNSLIDGLPASTLVTLVDCHI